MVVPGANATSSPPEPPKETVVQDDSIGQDTLNWSEEPHLLEQLKEYQEEDQIYKQQVLAREEEERHRARMAALQAVKEQAARSRKIAEDLEYQQTLAKAQAFNQASYAQVATVSPSKRGYTG